MWKDVFDKPEDCVTDAMYQKLTQGMKDRLPGKHSVVQRQRFPDRIQYKVTVSSRGGSASYSVAIPYAASEDVMNAAVDRMLSNWKEGEAR